MSTNSDTESVEVENIPEGSIPDDVWIISNDPNQIVMSKVSIKGLKSQSWKVDGVTPKDFKVIYKKKELAEDEYTVDYGENKNIGTGTITIIFMGMNGYTGTKKKTFKIVVANLEDKTTIAFQESEKLNAEGVYVVSYMGKAIKPKVVVTVKDTSKILVEGKDYTVSYKNNKKKADSTAKKAPSIIIKGKGNYSGSKTVTFTIK